MKKFYALIAAAFLSTTAFAADLPEIAPIPTAAPIVQADPNADTGVYVGARGGHAKEGKQTLIGGNVGYDFGRVRVEADYDRLLKKNGVEGNLVTGNVILENTMSNGVTPYVLAGVGVGYPGKALDSKDFDKRYGVYNVGGGLRYDVAKIGSTTMELDGRYRYVDRFENVGTKGEHLFTIGTNFKF